MNSQGELREIAQNFDALVYPNPSIKNATLLIKGEATNASIAVTDLNGKLIWRKDFRNEQTIPLPVEKLTAGIYLITVKTEKGNKILKFVKE